MSDREMYQDMIDADIEEATIEQLVGEGWSIKAIYDRGFIGQEILP